MIEISYSTDALKTLRRIPINISRLIRSKIELYAADPVAMKNNVKRPSQREGVLRLRVGDWRVIFTETGDVMFIVKIATRGSVYEN